MPVLYHPAVFPASGAGLRRKRLARAVKHALLCGALLSAVTSAETLDYGRVEVDGFYWTDPYYPFVLIREHIDLPQVRLGLTAGTINAASGMFGTAILDLAGLYVGSSQGGWGNVLMTDHSVLRLHGDTGRLTVGDNGTGLMIVSKGSLVDATLGREFYCNTWCGVLVGATAGSTGTLTLTDLETVGRFTDLVIGSTHLDNGYGTPGGITHATLNVQNGATLYSDNGRVGEYIFTSMSSGTEASYGQVTVSGANSAWHIGGAAYGVRAVLDGAVDAKTHAAIALEEGAQVTIAAQASSSGVSLGLNGGQAQMSLRDQGTALQLATGGYLNIGGAGGEATLTITNGATFSGGRDIRIGDGGKGVLTISGGGARALFDADSNLHLGAWHGDGAVNILYGGQMRVGSLWVGENGGSGLVTVAGAGSLLSSSFPAGPGNDIQLGTGGYGQLDVTAGATVTARGITMGFEGLPNVAGGTGNVHVSGAGSAIILDATSWHRLGLENGTLTVSDGALFDAGAGQAACWASWCGAFIGANAGADANVIVTGAGSRASFASSFRIGAADAGRMPVETYNYGIAGGTTHARVSVLDGGRLETTAVTAGVGSTGSATLGSERVEVELKIAGKDSVWTVTGIPGATDAAGFFTGVPRIAGSGANVSVDLQILQGGALQLGQAGQTYASMQLGASGGRTSALVSGAGSRIEFLTDNNMLMVGSNEAQASLSFERGAQLLGAQEVLVGAYGGLGELRFDASQADMRRGTTLAAGIFNGSGSISLTHGAQIELGSDAESAWLMVGYGSTSRPDADGTVAIDSASTLRLSSRNVDMPNSSGNPNYNPEASIGSNGHGELTIRNGGALIIQGLLPYRSGEYNPTMLRIGAASVGNAGGGYGAVYVGGAGSLLEVSGQDAGIYLGTNAGAVGQLTVQNGASVRTSVMQAGLYGGNGSLNIDRASVALNGQFTDNGGGAALVLGLGKNAFGSANLTRGATLDISNPGSAGAGLTVGRLGGTGVLNASGDSRITISAAPGLGYVKVGDDAGSIGAIVLNGARLDVGDGKVLLASGAGGNASLTMSAQSALHAGYVGVGSSTQGDGGSARLIVNDSTLTAGVLEIGGQGYVGGNGVLQAAIINRGTISPGNSPGTLTVDGSFLNASGGRLLLEIAGDSRTGYVTDHLLFTDGSNIDMRGMEIIFHFLGATDPLAFLASGEFNIDQFIAQQNGATLDHALFGGVSYSARADSYALSSFHFSTESGASFAVAAVPESSSWLLLLGGLALLSVVARHGRRPSSAARVPDAA